MAKRFSTPKAGRPAQRPQTIASQPTPVDPVNQALTNRYREAHAQPGAPAPRSPHLQQQIDDSIAHTPGIVTRGDGQ